MKKMKYLQCIVRYDKIVIKNNGKIQCSRYSLSHNTKIIIIIIIIIILFFDI